MEFSYKYIETDDEMGMFKDYLLSEKIDQVALDFECEFNLHSYGEKVCLIQVYDGAKFFLLDPFKISSIEIIKFLDNRNIVKIMYGVESDVKLIYSQYGIQMSSVFDQKLIINLLFSKNKGLADVLKEHLNIEIKDKHKYQRYNWTKRPLDKNAIQYALNDVAHLFELNTLLLSEVIKRNKYKQLINQILRTKYRIPGKIVKKSKLFKGINYRNLTLSEKEIFKKIYDIRENYSKEYDVPPFQFIANDVLFDIVNRKKDIMEIGINKKVPIEIQKTIKEKINELFEENISSFV